MTVIYPLIDALITALMLRIELYKKKLSVKAAEYQKQVNDIMDEDENDKSSSVSIGFKMPRELEENPDDYEEEDE